MNPEGIDEIRKALEDVTRVADEAFCRSRPDRTSETAALETAVLSVLGWAICQAHCVIEGLKWKTPQGVAPNVRSLLERS